MADISAVQQILSVSSLGVWTHWISSFFEIRGGNGTFSGQWKVSKRNMDHF